MVCGRYRHTERMYHVNAYAEYLHVVEWITLFNTEASLTSFLWSKISIFF